MQTDIALIVKCKAGAITNTAIKIYMYCLVVCFYLFHAVLFSFLLQYNFGKTIVDSGTTNLRLPTKVFNTLTAKMKANVKVCFQIYVMLDI